MVSLCSSIHGVISNAFVSPLERIRHRIRHLPEMIRRVLNHGSNSDECCSWGKEVREMEKERKEASGRVVKKSNGLG